MIDPATLTAIGHFGKPNGYKGNIVFFSDETCPMEEDMFVFVYDDGLPVPWRVTLVKDKGQDYVLHLAGIDSDVDAAKFTGLDAYVESHLLPDDIDDGQIYLTDLIGFHVLDDGKELGTIAGIDDSTANVLFDIEAADGKHILVPASDDFILAIDSDSKTLEMSLPQGLADLN